MAPLEAFQLRPTCEELSALATSPVGGAAAAGAPPRNRPETTALRPPVRATVTDKVPPAATLMGALTHAPWVKSVLMTAVRGPEPSSTVTFSRLARLSQSTA